MAQKLQYGIYLPWDSESGERQQWARSYNKQAALAFAKQHGGIVTSMRYDTETYDAPTFRVLSDVIADFTAS